MVNGKEFSLPGSGYDVLKKVIHSYILCGGSDVSLEEVSKKASMDITMVSRNNGFLSDIGVIDGGKKKSLTEIGRKLALAISHNDSDDLISAWKDLISGSQDMKGVLDMIQVQDGINKSNLPNKIASHFGKPGGKSKTGVNTIIDILTEANSIILDNDKYILNTKFTKPPERSSKPTNNDNDKHDHVKKNDYPSMIPIHINIELHLPISAEQSVYDAIFKSIRTNLMEPVNGLSDKS